MKSTNPVKSLKVHISRGKKKKKATGCDFLSLSISDLNLIALISDGLDLLWNSRQSE